MKKYYQLLLASVLTAFSPHVLAGSLSYTYVSVDYIKSSTKIDGVSETLDGTGYAVGMSIAVRPYIILMGGYTRSNVDVSSAGSRLDADIDATTLGFLIRAEVNDTTDFILGAAFINGNADVSLNGSFQNSVDADGGVTIVGLRSMVYESLEINGFVRKHSIEDTSTISVSLGAGYYVAKSVSLDLNYLADIENGSNLLTFGMTKYF